MTLLKTPAPCRLYNHDQRAAFARLERAISDLRVHNSNLAASDALLQIARDEVWEAALDVCCHHLLLVLNEHERAIIRACVPPRVLFSRPLTAEEKVGRHFVDTQLEGGNRHEASNS